MSSPSVSVLLPIFNADRFLATSLSSLERQTFENFEVVAVDDGSTDRSSEVLRSWSDRDQRFRVIRAPHQGLVAALNRGLAECRASLVARMDADDIAHPERLRLQSRALENRPELDVLGCRVIHFSTGGVGRGFRIYERWLNSLVSDDDVRRDLFVESPLAHPSVMVRRRALTDAGGYRDNGWPEDYDLWLRLARRGVAFGKLRRTLLRWRDHPDRLTRTDPRYAVERFLECKAHHLARGPLAGRRHVIVWGAGQTGRRLSKHLLREDVPIDAFVDIDPKKCGRTLRGRPVIPPRELDRRRCSSNADCVVLAAVASRGARAKIRRYLAKRGWRETKNFWCVA